MSPPSPPRVADQQRMQLIMLIYDNFIGLVNSYGEVCVTAHVARCVYMFANYLNLMLSQII